MSNCTNSDNYSAYFLTLDKTNFKKYENNSPSTIILMKHLVIDSHNYIDSNREFFDEGVLKKGMDQNTLNCLGFVTYCKKICYDNCDCIAVYIEGGKAYFYEFNNYVEKEKISTYDQLKNEFETGVTGNLHINISSTKFPIELRSNMQNVVSNGIYNNQTNSSNKTRNIIYEYINKQSDEIPNHELLRKNIYKIINSIFNTYGIYNATYNGKNVDHLLEKCIDIVYKAYKDNDFDYNEDIRITTQSTMGINNEISKFMSRQGPEHNMFGRAQQIMDDYKILQKVSRMINTTGPVTSNVEGTNKSNMNVEGVNSNINRAPLGRRGFQTEINGEVTNSVMNKTNNSNSNVSNPNMPNTRTRIRTNNNNNVT